MAFLRTVVRCSVNKNYGFLLNNLQNGSFGRINFNQIVLKSSATGSVVQDNTSAAVGTPSKDPLDITFENARAAFKSKTTWELVRAHIVYTLCTFEYLVEHNMQVSFFSFPHPYCRCTERS